IYNITNVPSPGTQILTPVVESLSGEFKPKAGIEFIVAPTGQYETKANEIAELKLSAFLYNYADFSVLHRGTFDDPQSRIALDAEVGIGVEFEVGLSLLDGFISKSLASDPIDYPFTKYNIANLNSCAPFSGASVVYTGG